MQCLGEQSTPNCAAGNKLQQHLECSSRDMSALAGSESSPGNGTKRAAVADGTMVVGAEAAVEGVRPIPTVAAVVDDYRASVKLGIAFSGFIIDPRTNVFISHWDLVTTLALVFVSLVTPYEVAFVRETSDVLFWLNRTIDVIFITDMVLQMHIAFKVEDAKGTRWVTESRAVARHYLCSRWFGLDFFSILTSIFDFIGGGEREGEAGKLKVLRAVRTLRLMKLIKLARGSRLFKRWEMKMSIDYSYLTLASLMVVILLTCHWVSCIWGLQVHRIALWNIGSRCTVQRQGQIAETYDVVRLS